MTNRTRSILLVVVLALALVALLWSAYETEEPVPPSEDPPAPPAEVVAPDTAPTAPGPVTEDAGEPQEAPKPAVPPVETRAPVAQPTVPESTVEESADVEEAEEPVDARAPASVPEPQEIPAAEAEETEAVQVQRDAPSEESAPALAPVPPVSTAREAVGTGEAGEEAEEVAVTPVGTHAADPEREPEDSSAEEARGVEDERQPPVAPAATLAPAPALISPVPTTERSVGEEETEEPEAPSDEAQAPGPEPVPLEPTAETSEADDERREPPLSQVGTIVSIPEPGVPVPVDRVPQGERQDEEVSGQASESGVAQADPSPEESMVERQGQAAGAADLSAPEVAAGEADAPEHAEPSDTRDPRREQLDPTSVTVNAGRPAELTELPAPPGSPLVSSTVPEATDPGAEDVAGAVDSGALAGVSAAPSVPGVARTAPGSVAGRDTNGEPGASLSQGSVPPPGSEDQPTASPGRRTLDAMTEWVAEFVAPEGVDRGEVPRDAELAAGVPLAESRSAPFGQPGRVASNETGEAPEPQSVSVADWLVGFLSPDRAGLGDTPRDAELAGGSPVGSPSVPLGQPGLVAPGATGEASESQSVVADLLAGVVAPDSVDRGEDPRDAELADGFLAESPSVPVGQPGLVAPGATGEASESKSVVADLLAGVVAPDSVDRGEDLRDAELADGFLAESPSVPLGQPGLVAPGATGEASESQSVVADLLAGVVAPDSVDRGEDLRDAELADGFFAESPSVPLGQPGLVAPGATGEASESQSVVADLLAGVVAPDSVDRGEDPRDAELADGLLAESPSVPVDPPGRIAPDATGGASGSQSIVADLLAGVVAPDSVDRGEEPRDAELADGLLAESPSVPVDPPGRVSSDGFGEAPGPQALVDAGEIVTALADETPGPRTVLPGPVELRGSSVPAVEQPATVFTTGSGVPVASLPAAAPGVELPRFDVVRSEPHGAIVVAGRAPSGALVEVVADGDVVADVQASDRGEWVAIVDAPISAGESVLALRAIVDGGTPVEGAAPVAILRGEVPGSAIAVELAPDGGARLFAPPEPGVAGITIESLSYSEEGDVEITGGTLAEVPVEIAINGLGGGTAPDAAEAITVLAGHDGRWSAVVPGGLLAPGRVYQIRAMATLDDGSVVEASTPFKRNRVRFAFQEGSVVVQPGNNLWIISRHVYGRGIQYHWIYQANSDQIDDPDLIYPGQVFIVPEDGPELPY